MARLRWFSRRVALVMVASVIAVSLAACSGSGGSGEPDSPLLVSPADGGSLDAIVQLRIVVSDGCVLVIDAGAPEDAVAALWPFGTTFDSSSGQLRSPTGTLFGDGDRFEGGGGFLDDGSQIVDLADPRTMTEAALGCVPGPDFYVVSSFGDEDPIVIDPAELPVPGVTTTSP